MRILSLAGALGLSKDAQRSTMALARHRCSYDARWESNRKARLCEGPKVAAEAGMTVGHAGHGTHHADQMSSLPKELPTDLKSEHASGSNKKGSCEKTTGFQAMGTLRCDGCGEEFFLGHNPQSVDKRGAEKQAKWLEKVLAEEHERDRKHSDRIELPE
jgi:hypothetical protein